MISKSVYKHNALSTKYPQSNQVPVVAALGRLRQKDYLSPKTRLVQPEQHSETAFQEKKKKNQDVGGMIY